MSLWALDRRKSKIAPDIYLSANARCHFRHIIKFNAEITVKSDFLVVKTITDKRTYKPLIGQNGTFTKKYISPETVMVYVTGTYVSNSELGIIGKDHMKYVYTIKGKQGKPDWNIIPTYHGPWEFMKCIHKLRNQVLIR